MDNILIVVEGVEIYDWKDKMLEVGSEERGGRRCANPPPLYSRAGNRLLPADIELEKIGGF